jgi:oxygen-independent coproporphyrinogen-3 oxidase
MTPWDIYEQGHAMLTAQGYQQYEISAYAKEGYQCRHNLNYWRFGDYLGIGCGAHGKVTICNQQILRTASEASERLSGSEPPLSGQPMAGERGRSAARVLHEPVQIV